MSRPEPGAAAGGGAARNVTSRPWLAVAGDIMIQRAFTSEELADPLFEWVRGAGLALANLEAPLTAGGRPAEKAVNMRMDPERVADVAAMGFGAV
ncbi:MAG TPA: CapA family protein, partial [Bacillota bacterium]